MIIEPREIKVRDLVEGYEDNDEDGVFGYSGMLDIRPPYQREFIYKEKQRDAVIDTVNKGFPLNVMYWAVRDEGGYEVIDGQQRTISVCQYVEGDFAHKERYFHNLEEDEQEKILEYPLMVYLCTGNPSEKLEWFKTINIAGEKLTDQELRNAVYSGSWVSDAKRYFSKNGCAAYAIGGKYLKGSPIRQEFLETAIKWISGNEINHYMASNQNEANANDLWLYFQKVINWVEAVFPKYRKEMKGVEWGGLYNEYGHGKFDTEKLEETLSELMLDDEVESKKGIYPYVITGKQKFLNLRTFSGKLRREAYEKQKGICPICKKHFEYDQMEADHIDPWHEGGKTVSDNCQMLCKEDNRRKSGK